MKDRNSKSIDAGDFNEWLNGICNAFKYGSQSNVPCGDCVGCCSSSQFINITDKEVEHVKDICENYIIKSPITSMSMIGYTKQGLCPLLKIQKCVAYSDRPVTCRIYDCRIFSAAGISAGNFQKRLINERVESWVFSYSDEKAKEVHRAIKKMAVYIQKEFNEKSPLISNPIFLAMMAIKHHDYMLSKACVSVESINKKIQEDIEKNTTA